MSIIKETVNHHAGNSYEINKEYSYKLFDSGVVTKSEEALYGIKCYAQKVSFIYIFFLQAVSTSPLVLLF